MAEAVTAERYERLVELAVQSLADAERCAEVECFYPACVMAGAAIEAALLVHICVREQEIRDIGAWRDGDARQAPFDWKFDSIIEVAVKMLWFPTTKELSSKEPVEKLVGEVGDAVRFVQNVRNLAAHPGKHAYEKSWLTLGRREYAIVHGVAQIVFERIYDLFGEPKPAITANE